MRSARYVRCSKLRRRWDDDRDRGPRRIARIIAGVRERLARSPFYRAGASALDDLPALPIRIGGLGSGRIGDSAGTSGDARTFRGCARAGLGGDRTHRGSQLVKAAKTFCCRCRLPRLIAWKDKVDAWMD